ncbi:YceI family protein [Mucilaginibacter angelicae]|uniref:YceI family protein n=1 Tax=Mucilaginibacter angelicae TaxID=869718 RepID=A0ABV6L9D6_9SPHI
MRRDRDMKKMLLLLLMVCLAAISKAQYKPVEQSSNLKFTVKNLGFGVDGTFSGFEGDIIFDPQNVAGSSFDVTINASTVNTDNSLRDEHLRGESYFDIKDYPKIRLVSGKVAVLNKSGMYQLTGELTMKGKAKPVSFPFSATPTADGYVFKGSFKINRKDFGIGGTSTIADELEVNISVMARKS